MAEELTPNQAPVAVLEYEPSGFERMLMMHKSKLLLVAGLSVAGALTYFGIKVFKEHKHAVAGVAFTRAQTAADLRKVAEDHPGQIASGNALIQAAQMLAAERPGEAIDILKKFLVDFPTHPLRDLASYRVGDFLLAFGDKASAEKELDAVGKSSSIYAPMALMRLGDMKWDEGKTDEAKAIFENILKSPVFAGSPVHEQAKQRIDSDIKTKPPVLVEYVPEPETAVPGAPTPGAANAPGAGIVPQIISPGLLDNMPAPDAGSLSLDGAPSVEGLPSTTLDANLPVAPETSDPKPKSPKSSK